MNKYYGVALICLSVHAMNSMEKEVTSKNNDWNAKKYQDNSQLQYNAAMRVIERIPFKGNERILDIGCGNGKITAEIANKVPEGSVQGVDVSENMINFARVNHNQSNLSFDVKDIAKSKYAYELIEQFATGTLDMPLRKYDIVTAFSSLSWVKDQQQAFTNIAQLLVAHKGKLIAGLAHEDSDYLHARYAMHTHDTWKGFFENYEVPYYPSSKEKMEKILKQAGLNPVIIREGGAPYTFATRQDFINWMRVIPVQKDRIPEELQEDFFNDIVTEYLKRTQQKEDEPIQLTIAALFVEAETLFDISGL